MDFESQLILFLDAETDIDWYHSVPSTRPQEFGTVSRSGGPVDMVVDDMTLTVKIWAATWERVRALSKIAARAIVASPYGIANVMSAEILSVYDDPDTDTGLPRRRITAHVIAND